MGACIMVWMWKDIAFPPIPGFTFPTLSHPIPFFMYAPLRPPLRPYSHLIHLLLGRVVRWASSARPHIPPLLLPAGPLNWNGESYRNTLLLLSLPILIERALTHYVSGYSFLSRLLKGFEKCTQRKCLPFFILYRLHWTSVHSSRSYAWETKFTRTHSVRSIYRTPPFVIVRILSIRLEFYYHTAPSMPPP